MLSTFLTFLLLTLHRLSLTLLTIIAIHSSPLQMAGVLSTGLLALAAVANALPQGVSVRLKAAELSI